MFTGLFFRGPILRGTFEGSLRFFEYSLVSNQGASGAARNPSPILFEKSAKEGGDLRRKSFHGSFYRRGRSDTPSRVGEGLTPKPLSLTAEAKSSSSEDSKS